MARRREDGLDRLLAGLPELRCQVDLLIDQAEDLLGLADEIARQIFNADRASRRLAPSATPDERSAPLRRAAALAGRGE